MLDSIENIILSCVNRIKQTLRILHITTEFPPVIDGGLAIAVRELVNASMKAGLTVKVVHVRDSSCKRYKKIINQQEERNGAWQEETSCTDLVEVIDVIINISYAAKKCLDVIRRWRPDIIHLHTFNVLPIANAIRREFSDMPLVYTVHTLERNEEYTDMSPLEYLIRSAIQEALINISDRIIVLSSYEKYLIGKYYPQALHRTRVLGNGIEYPAKSVRLMLHTENITADKPNIVLYVGRFIPRKGLQDLFEAIPLVLDKRPATQFVLVGGEPGISKLEIEKKWLQDGLLLYRDQIIFKGWVSHQALERLYELADILVVPSRYEPFGLVVLEGMSHGLAVVASSVGGPLDIIQHGQTGFLFEPKNVKALSYYLIFLLENHDFRQGIGESAAKEVHQRWQWTQIVKKVYSMYQELLNDKKLTDII
jgi:glycogen synthase